MEVFSPVHSAGAPEDLLGSMMQKLGLQTCKSSSD